MTTGHGPSLHEHAAAHGIIIPAEFPMDGTLFRFSPNGTKNKDGFLTYHINSDGSHVCWYGNWATHPPENALIWSNRDRSQMSAEDKRKLEKEIAVAKARAQAEREKKHKHAPEKAKNIWKSAMPAAGHPYLREKGVKNFGLRTSGRELLVPVRDPLRPVDLPV